MDPILLKAYSDIGYFVAYEDENHIELEERGESLIIDPDKEAFWENILDYMWDDFLRLKLLRDLGMCKSCGERHCEIITLHTEILRPEIVTIRGKYFDEKHLKFRANFPLKSVPGIREMLTKIFYLEVQAGEIVYKYRDFRNFQFYIPIRIISGIVVPV